MEKILQQREEHRDYKVSVVIFAGGVGSRMSGAQKPKQFLELAGEPIIGHVLDHFEQHPLVDFVVCVCVEDWIEYLTSYVEARGYAKVSSIVPGGTKGQYSIYNGLQELSKRGLADSGDVVLVHDGVRPLIDAACITACVDSVIERGCTAVTAPVTETVVRVEDGHVVDVIDRASCKLARAPQGFRFGELWACHQRAREDGIDSFIDSISLMSYYGYKIYTVDGPEENIKITTPRDFFSFKGFMDMREYEQLWN